MHPLISNECRTALDLASRNDGYLMQDADNPVLDTLRRAGLVYTRPTGAEGYVIARAVQDPPKRIYSHGSRYAHRKRWARAEAIGEVNV